jgi:hypothetical protein
LRGRERERKRERDKEREKERKKEGKRERKRDEEKEFDTCKARVAQLVKYKYCDSHRCTWVENPREGILDVFCQNP